MSETSIEFFKAFVKNHPKIIDEVKSGKWTWKELYEEWYVLGEDDEKWLPYVNQKNHKTTDGFSHVLSKLKDLNLEDVQKNIVEMKGLVATIQDFVRDLKPNQPNQHSMMNPPLHNNYTYTHYYHDNGYQHYK